MNPAPVALATSLSRALQVVDAALVLRAEVDADIAFIEALYADTRHDELAPVPWPEADKRRFLDDQCRLQHDHYRRHYAAADFLVIENVEASIGRLYVHATTKELRVMDIALLREQRGRGIGTALVVATQRWAAVRGIAVTLHVEPANPAQRLYRRLGFSLIENRGVYDFLGWTPPIS